MSGLCNAVNMIRSVLAFRLMDLAISVAPESEKASAAIALRGHLERIIK